MADGDSFHFKLFLSCFSDSELKSSYILRCKYDEAVGDAINRIIRDWQGVTVENIRSCASDDANDASLTPADTPVQVLREFNSKYLFVELKKRDAPSGPVQNNTNSLLGDCSSRPPSTSSQPTQSTANPMVEDMVEKKKILVTNGSIENNLFGESSSAVEQKATTKGSIMDLYGGQQRQQQFGVPGGIYMPQQQVPQQVPQQNMAGMNNMPMQQPMYGNQMGMMGTQQQGPMGNVGMPQEAMMRPNGNMGMYGAQQQPQMQFQPMLEQMANMRLSQPGPMGGAGMMQNGIPAYQGWGGQPTGQTLFTNLWQ